jgi:hypothetical protein
MMHAGVNAYLGNEGREEVRESAQYCWWVLLGKARCVHGLLTVVHNV